MKSSTLRILSRFSVIVFSILAMLAIDILDFIYSPIAPNLSEPTTFDLKPGKSLHAVANDLHEQHFIQSPIRLLLYAKWLHADRHLQSGEYEITSHTTPKALLTNFVRGHVKRYKFAIIEGWDYAQLTRYILSQPFLDAHEFAYENFSSQLSDRGLNSEGLFFPDTYFYSPKHNDVTVILKKAHECLMTFLNTAWDNRDRTIPIDNPYEALIVASMIEKETALESERPQVAAVIYNRLRKHMRLQIDPTVIYALGTAYDGKIHKLDLNIDSPYNTYRVTGLPPTPIAFASQSAIKAALHPSHTSVLYFVAKPDGGHAFSEDLTEHNRFVDAYVANEDMKMTDDSKIDNRTDNKPDIKTDTKMDNKGVSK